MDLKNDLNENQDQNRNRRPNWPLLVVILGLVFIMMFGGSRIFSAITNQFTQQMSYDEFVKNVKNGKVAEAVLYDNNEWTIKLKDDSKAYYTVYMPDQNIVPLLIEYGVKFYGQHSSSFMEYFLIYILPMLLLVGFFIFLTRKMGAGMGAGGGIFNVGKSNAKKHSQKDTGITLADVAGEEEAKESLTEIVDFLHNPQKYTKIGAKLPKGALLVGPPGTGKTLLAKAVAGEAHCPFFSLSGSDFVEMFVGVGASRVRDLFKQAQAEAPCIIFIDEIDAIGKSRDSVFSGANDEREQTLNQLLAEMDGFDSSKGVIVMGATNRPEILDKALLRPGRFDRRIIVDKPDLKGREEILKVHAKNVNMADNADLHEIALATSGAVGSDLANMINEAAINAVKNGRMAVTQADLFEAVEVVLVGKEKKDRIMSQQERRIVSYHEVGHALIAALQKNAEPVQKITIVPRTMGALGYVMQTPEEEKYLNTKKEIEDMIVVALGGRAAEEIIFGDVTTGAANDIEKATKYARAMITMYGMSDYFGLMQLEAIESQYLEQRRTLNCADSTAAEVDREVRQMLADSYATAKQMLSAHRYELDKIAAYLIEKETITGEEFMSILRKCQDEKALEQKALEEKALAEQAAEETSAEETPAAETSADEVTADTAETVTAATEDGE
ncbi:MAG: ATP-dependent zinc metalloprotease FtsH [Lachnospiraceae bacterium]|nr:ATP-dependent zinc metalloprotease FtsH [Lachnospiraceae bacterium]